MTANISGGGVTWDVMNMVRRLLKLVDRRVFFQASHKCVLVRKNTTQMNLDVPWSFRRIRLHCFEDIDKKIHVVTVTVSHVHVKITPTCDTQNTLGNLLL
jgi:hypothetical protein